MRRKKQQRSSQRQDDLRAQPEWSQLLIDAATKPGIISTAYSRFWNYSVGNQLLAMFQCMIRNIEPGPIHTFRGWLDLGRHVKKGERAITLCMPVSVKRSAKHDDDQMPSPVVGEVSAEQASAPNVKTVFVHRPHWFVLAQTEGDDYIATEIPAWSEARALEALKISRTSFRHPDGNCQGYARERDVAVSPIAFLPHRTLFHEVAHVMLGHTKEMSEGMSDGDERTPKDVREVEAECVALICCESLALAGAEFSRGYVQHWLHGQLIAEKSAQRVFRAADEILRAGRADSTNQEVR